MSTYLVNYRVGDIVDIKANAAQQKGMPHKYYHGFVRFPRLVSPSVLTLTLHVNAIGGPASYTTSLPMPSV